MQCSLVPRIACPRLNPSSAAQPDPGSRLLHGEMPSRRYAQRVRWRRLPPIEAMFRSCSEALSSNAREMAGYAGFVARRLKTESVGLIFGARIDEAPDLAGLPELRLPGLPDDDADDALHVQAPPANPVRTRRSSPGGS